MECVRCEQQIKLSDSTFASLDCSGYIHASCMKKVDYKQYEEWAKNNNHQKENER